MDLFGYGYVEVFKSVCKVWKLLIEVYFFECELLKVVLLLVDIWWELGEVEMGLFEVMNDVGICLILVVIKVDKEVKMRCAGCGQ